MALGIKKVSVLTVTMSSVVIWIGFYAWRIMFNNFAVEVFDASATDVGMIQAAREIPGLLAFSVGALTLYLTESRIAALSIVVLGLGMVLCGLSSSLAMLAAATVVASFGFHYFEPTNSSQLLALTKASDLGKAQGHLRSWESAAGLAGAGVVLLLTFVFDFRMTFYFVGAFVMAVGAYLVIALPANRGKAELRMARPRKKYWLYYTLAFLRGCRRHIFTTFAIFLLVKNHSLDISVISTLMLVGSLINIFAFRWLGRLTDRLGERYILASSSFLLVFIFTGYACVTWLPALIVFYLFDNFLFGSSIALKSYIRKISTPEDLTGCLSFGMTANHITAVVIPVLGGVAWSIFGYQVTFIAGAAIVFVDLLFALRVPRNNPR